MPEQPSTSAAPATERTIACPKHGVVQAGRSCPSCGGKTYDLSIEDDWLMLRDLRRIHVGARKKGSQGVSIATGVVLALLLSLMIGLGGLLMGLMLIGGVAAGKAVAGAVDAVRARAQPAGVRELDRRLSNWPH